MRVDFSRLYDCINPVYRPYVEDFRRIQVFKGGAGAGKSRFIAQRAIYRTVTISKHNGVCVRQDRTNNRSSTFSELCEVINEWCLQPLFKINRADGKEEIQCLTNGNKIIFRGLDDSEKIKSIIIPGGGVAWIWVEESSEIEEGAFNQLLLRIRGYGTKPKIIILSFNPIDVDHWIKSRFFDNPEPIEKCFVCESTYQDNRYLTEEDRATIEAFKHIDWYYYQVYALNQWGSISTSKVFHNIKIHDFEISEWHLTNIRQGIDFGWAHASAFIRGGYQENDLYLFNEVYTKKTENRDFGKMIMDTGFPLEQMITADSADPGNISELNTLGLSVYPAVKGPGSLHNGIQFIKRVPTIHIHKTSCPNAAREFPRFKYREDRSGKIYDNQYVELNDDTIAATRYAFEEFFIDGPREYEGMSNTPTVYF